MKTKGAGVGGGGGGGPPERLTRPCIGSERSNLDMPTCWVQAR